jgi:hypothetical protein
LREKAAAAPRPRRGRGAGTGATPIFMVMVSDGKLVVYVPVVRPREEKVLLE